MVRSRNYISVSKNEDLFLLSLPDCVSLSEKGGCIFLRISKCRGKGCSFMKSRNELKEGQTRCMHRIANLSLDEQMRISRMYYGGKMPWNDLTAVD
ncbi:MAG TPA: hypothetical protein DEB10_04465 [Ruminococcaceae bacterium]|nr:hypothetical protein [Oscillospiraceae bacterium]